MSVKLRVVIFTCSCGEEIAVEMMGMMSEVGKCPKCSRAIRISTSIKRNGLAIFVDTPKHKSYYGSFTRREDWLKDEAHAEGYRRAEE